MGVSYYKDIYNYLCEKHPNRKIYVISDHHFYHDNIIKYHRTEFNDAEQMNEYIINKHNSIVDSDDIVFFLGDFSFKNSFIKALLEKMNGHKYLLLGNHDSEKLIRTYGNLGFDGIFTNPVKIKDAYLSHYPLRDGEFDNFNFHLLVKEFNCSDGTNYHGHLHTKDIGNKPFVNVCCEAQDYTPLLIGHTQILEKANDNPLVINSKQFEDILDFLKKEKSLDPSLVISDYIYSILLEAINRYANESFIYGSFPIYKKYGYRSNFSDLDIGLIYNDSLSKNKNSELFKEMFDRAFESTKQIANLDVSIYKRLNNLCIFNLLYKSKSGNTYSGYFDANLVPLDVYRDTDFITFYGYSTLEKILKQNGKLINEFTFPKYESRFLTINGDIANILLQILFQQGFADKKLSALKKLKYIYNSHGKHDIINVSNLEDIMIRFFIRNILFFYTTKRRKEIEYINEGYKNLDDFMSIIPSSLRLQLEEILRNPRSLFNSIYKELSLVSFNEIPDKSKELIKIVKQTNNG